MASNLSDCKIGPWILTVDLLGTAERMAEQEWLESTKELLDAILLAISAVRDETDGDPDVQLHQYGDSLTFFAREPQILMRIGVRVQCALYDKDILAQLGITGRGAYLLDNTTLHRLAEHTPGISVSVLVGQGFARSHVVNRGVKGPRFLIDEEGGHIPLNNSWERFSGGPGSASAYTTSDVRWWRDFPSVLQVAQARNARLRADLNKERSTRNEFRHVEKLVDRDIRGLEKRIEHYEAFIDLLKADPVLK